MIRKHGRSAETAYDPKAWEEHRDVCPLSEHCFAVAYVVQALIGGSILCGRINDERHAWNLLPSGDEIDLSGSQYGGDGLHPVGKGRLWKQPAAVNPRFQLFLDRVVERLMSGIFLP